MKKNYFLYNRRYGILKTIRVSKKHVFLLIYLYKYIYIYIGLTLKIIHFLALVVPILINVAIVTLLERKFLSGTQIRTGPVKNGIIGIFQPFADVVKLFGCQISLLVYNINYLYLISPVIRIFIALIFLLVLPLKIGHLR